MTVALDSSLEVDGAVLATVTSHTSIGLVGRLEGLEVPLTGVGGRYCLVRKENLVGLKDSVVFVLVCSLSRGGVMAVDLLLDSSGSSDCKKVSAEGENLGDVKPSPVPALEK